MSQLCTRRRFLESAGAAAVAAATPSAVWCATAPQQPGGFNVLLLMTDEQHYRSLSSTGNPYVQTPHMDRIGREGALFDNATCVTPYCSPSRASIITGVYPHTHGILNNVGAVGTGQQPLPQGAFANTETILHRRGYATAHRGKWHLGDTGDFDCYESRAYAGKNNRDYEQFLDQHLPAAKSAARHGPGTYLGRPVKMIPAVEKACHDFYAIPKNGVAYISTIGRTVIPPELLPETQITNQVLELIDQHAGQNFMITASWVPPHDLWVIPDPYYSLLDRSKIELSGSTDLPGWDRQGPSRRLGGLMGPAGIREYVAIYHGMVKYIDDQVGRVLRKLDERGLTGNTLVLFTTDHGDMVGAHGCVGKSIFSFFDDLVRIPLLARLPGRIQPGTVVHQPVSQIDFMPTILDYLGVPAPEKIHGRSLRPLVEGRSVPWRDYAFCQWADAGRMLRTERYKLVLRGKPQAVALYDLHNDPHEDHNLAADPARAATVRQMHRQLLEVMAADGDPQRSRYAKAPLA